tara:strand:+ start:612 stop:866 length:255 start_codon:yes stop_codon:yes gene_type:complete
MSSFARKIRRKKIAKSKKTFMKHFKEKMMHFKKQVKCSVCDYHPQEGENIDDWKINQESNTIDLICTNCYTDKENSVGRDSTDV